MKSKLVRGWNPFVGSLVLLSAVSVGLYVIQAVRLHSWADWYLIWNLGLAWLPLVFAGWLLGVLKRKPWSSWQGIVLSLLWLVFLPNSFYMVTDYIHIADSHHHNLLYAAVLFSSFILTGLVLGCTSLYLIHMQLRKRVALHSTVIILLLIMLLCSFAMYLGRDLRWNTWDLVINPAGILFDVSDRVISPSDHPSAFTSTGTFLVFVSSIYFVGWSLVRTIRRSLV